MRPIAPNAFLRPCQRRARSASSRATRTVRAPFARADRLDRRDVVLESRGRAVELDEQRRGRVGRIAGGVDRCLDGANRRLVDHLERGGNDARRDDGR